jgi:hypothetical protein
LRIEIGARRDERPIQHDPSLPGRRRPSDPWARSVHYFPGWRIFQAVLRFWRTFERTLGSSASFSALMVPIFTQIGASVRGKGMDFDCFTTRKVCVNLYARR